MGELTGITYVVDALFAKDANPAMTALALEAVSALAAALPEVAAVVSSSPSPSPCVVEARTSVLYGAFLAGLAVASTGIALQHKLAHVLGGSFGLPHAEAHAVILPHTSSYNLGTLSARTLGRLAQALGVVVAPGGESGTTAAAAVVSPISAAEETTTTAAAAIADGVLAGLDALRRNLGVPTSLSELGLREEDIDRAAEIALETPYWNPRPLEQGKIREILRRAWAGEPARMDL